MAIEYPVTGNMLPSNMLRLRRNNSLRPHRMRVNTPWLGWLVTYRIKHGTKYLTDSIWTPKP